MAHVLIVCLHTDHTALTRPSFSCCCVHRTAREHISRSLKDKVCFYQANSPQTAFVDKVSLKNDGERAISELTGSFRTWANAKNPRIPNQFIQFLCAALSNDEGETFF